MDKEIKKFLNKDIERMFNLMNHGMFITNTNYIAQFANDTYIKYSGIKREELLGRNIYDLRPGGYLPQLFEHLKPIYDVPRRVGNAESYCDYLPIIIEGKLIGGMVIVKDALKVRELSDKLEESSKRIIQLDNSLKNSFKAGTYFSNIISSENGLKDTIKMSRTAAQSDSYVLLLGESGTGKEVIAQAIHNESSRKEYPFVDVNCAALPETLLESELFGYEGGAFSGAKSTGKMGLFEIANGGTIFLDEIAEMPINLQSKLLRVLQEKKIRKVGGEKSILIDVRVIAATNKDIVQLINENKFRQDLYYRLAVFVISLPPLRERKADIPLLVDSFIQEHQKKKKCFIGITDEVIKLLMNYKWPGNIRELKNAIEYAVNSAEEPQIKPENLPNNIIRNYNMSYLNNGIEIGITLEKATNYAEKNLICQYLTIYGNSADSKRRIATELGISISSLYSKIKKYTIE